MNDLIQGLNWTVVFLAPWVVFAYGRYAWKLFRQGDWRRSEEKAGTFAIALGVLSGWLGTGTQRGWWTAWRQVESFGLDGTWMVNSAAIPFSTGLIALGALLHMTSAWGWGRAKWLGLAALCVLTATTLLTRYAGL